MKQIIKLAKKTQKQNKPVKRPQKDNRLKRKLKNIDFGEVFIVALAIGFIIGAISGFVTIFNTPLEWPDTVFTRFLDFVLYTLVGGVAGAGVLFILFVFVGCFVVIANFISDLRG